MTTDDAAALLGGVRLDSEPAIWADLGCGEGTFTMALATLLPAGSIVHALDRDPQAVRRLPPRHHGVTIVPHVGDFTTVPWPFSSASGVVLANALHYVADPRPFLRDCLDAMPEHPRILIVEYDTEVANSWVPYPISRAALQQICDEEGLAATFLAKRPSLYRRAEIYSAMIQLTASTT